MSFHIQDMFCLFSFLGERADEASHGAKRNWESLHLACSILLLVDVSPMPSSDDTDDESVIFDLVQDSIVPLSEAVSLLTRQFLGSWRTGVVGK